jgi:hypothetical membrane protein
MGVMVLVGAFAWLLAVQFFVAQVAVASAWAIPFSLKTRYISDLGNTACGHYPPRSSLVVCSPWHAGMNASFIAIGITMAIGAILARTAFEAGWSRRIAVALFVAAGAGVVMVGVYPENENITNHSFGAGVNFIAGNAALILFGLAVPSAPRQAPFVWFSIMAGVVGLVATGLFVSRHDLGLGPGGIERFAAYTITIWQIIAGLVVLRARKRLLFEDAH